VRDKSKIKKIAVIGTAGIPANYGGFETLAENLVTKLDGVYDFTVYCSKKNYSSKPKKYLRSKLVYLPFSANGKSSIIYDTLSIIHSLFYADVLLILGVSSAFVLPLVKFFTRKKIIVNIDGLEWKRDKWGELAKKYLHYQEYLAVKYAHICISDNHSIEQYVLKSYNRNSILITYGANHVKKENISNKMLSQYNIDNEYCFSVCRIEPENNVDITLETFSKNNKIIVIIGNWKSSNYGLKLREKYSVFKNIKMLDPIYEQKTLDELRSNCKIYIHGHSAGGTNPSLVEAMYLGLPIFAYDVDYNRFTTHNTALFYEDEKSLGLLVNENTDKNDLLAMGNKLNQIAVKNYNWQNIATDYAALFDK